MGPMRKLAALAPLLLLAGCGSVERLARFEDVQIEVGRPFPNITLPTLANGAPASIAQFRGKKTLLHVFASW